MYIKRKASLSMIKVSTMVSDLAMKGNLQAIIKGFVLIQVNLFSISLESKFFSINDTK